MTVRPMKWKKFIVGYVLALAMLLFAQRHPAPTPSPTYSSIVDLTHSLNSETPTFESQGKRSFNITNLASITQDGYFSRQISIPEHFGTHIDAPAHFAPGLWTVDQIPSERLIAPLVVLDVQNRSRQNPDYQVNMDDIIRWEQAHGPVPMGAVVMARTGWDYRWNSARQYRNADRKAIMHFPGFSMEAAQFLVQGRNTLGLGIDTLSVDNGASKDFPVHKYTLSHSLYHLENVANLGAVPESGATVVVAPAKLEGGSGGPVRILALLK
jgi:kynurenine formamidase